MSTSVAIAVNGLNDPDLTQATSIEVSERAGQTTTYSLKYGVSIIKGDIPFLTDKRLDAGSELSIVEIIDLSTLCLVKGPVHGHDIHMEHGGAGSTLVVKGSDTSVKMDLESRSVVWQNVTDSDAVQTILSTYGYLSDVETTTAGHYENKNTLVQRESDLSFIRRLARRNGCYFWVTCDPMGTEIAHFRRPSLGGAPAGQLTINLDSPTITKLDIDWDIEKPTSIAGLQLDLNTKDYLELTVQKTPQTILGDKGIQQITNDIRSVFLSAPVNDTGDLTSRGEGALIEADWFIHASCETTARTLGFIIRPYTIIELKGAGSRHSGKYFVLGVTHTIDATAHKMNLQLVRNGWGDIA
ncbi:MAG: contractile injection system protein, VgrG/Pvc8 family [Bacteroidetes bacterium]|nr:contractile injection system protein, VgrG/Pvc8 family [Bacteroidota bacterium]